MQVAEVFELVGEAAHLGDLGSERAVDVALGVVVDARAAVVGVLGLAGRQRALGLGDLVEVFELGQQATLLEIPEL